MKGISRAAVMRPVLTSMMFLGVVLLGVVSFTRLKVDLLPEIDFPSISVATTYEGAGPEEIETLITRPMERAVSTVEGIDRLESFSTEGRSRVALRFVWGTNLDSALNDVRAAVERTRATLPDEAETPVVYKFDIGSFPILEVGLSGQLDQSALRQLAELQLGPRLESVPGVASIDVRGGSKREIHIELDAERLRALAVAPAQVAEAVRAQNTNVPVGTLDQHDKTVLVRTLQEDQDPNMLGDILVTQVTTADGQRRPIYVRDVARVVDTFEESMNMVRINGQSGLRLSILKQSGENTVEVAQRVFQEIEQINKDYEGRLQLNVLSDTSEYIQNSINNVQQSALYGAVLAVLVLMLFLRRLRPTLIVAIGIPISVIGIFTLMYYAGITLNLISFGGVALGIGMLVDNSIVVLENIFRKLEAGLSPGDAAVEGAGEVTTAVIASTITTLVVFVPVIFLSGFASIFFGEMAFVVSFALVCSLAVSLTLLPMASSRLLRLKDAREQKRGVGATIGRGFDALDERYGKIVDWCITRPKRCLFIALVMLGASLVLVPQIGTELLPTGDESEVRINLELPVGTRMEITAQYTMMLEEIAVREIPELVSVQTVVGTPGFYSTRGGESSRVFVRLVRPGERARSSEEIAAALRPKLQGLIPGANLRVQAGGGLWVLRVLRGGGEERLQIQVRGYDLQRARVIADQVNDLMLATPGISAVQNSLKDGALELRIIPDRVKLAARGLDSADMAAQIQTYVQGSRASVLRAQGDEFAILVRIRQEDRRDPAALRELPVMIPGVGAVPLRDVATIEEVRGPLTIERENQSRVVYLDATVDDTRDLGSIAEELRQGLRQIEIPDDFSVLIKGEIEQQEDNFGSLLMGIILAILLVYMVMASQFESLLQPLYIMLSIPFAAIGVIIALVVTKTTFNLQSFMGCVVLTGIVVNNAIVLIDYINLLRREQGMALTDAVAMSARRRLRPILMTTATTLLGLIPVAIGVGEGGETQAPLARAVIGGLFVSSAISLIIIPVIYQSVEGWRERRLAAATPAAADAA